MIILLFKIKNFSFGIVNLIINGIILINTYTSHLSNSLSFSSFKIMLNLEEQNSGIFFFAL